MSAVQSSNYFPIRLFNYFEGTRKSNWELSIMALEQVIWNGEYGFIYKLKFHSQNRLWYLIALLIQRERIELPVLRELRKPTQTDSSQFKRGTFFVIEGRWPHLKRILSVKKYPSFIGKYQSHSLKIECVLTLLSKIKRCQLEVQTKQ